MAEHCGKPKAFPRCAQARPVRVPGRALLPDLKILRSHLSLCAGAPQCTCEDTNTPEAPGPCQA